MSKARWNEMNCIICGKYLYTPGLTYCSPACHNIHKAHVELKTPRAEPLEEKMTKCIHCGIEVKTSYNGVYVHTDGWVICYKGDGSWRAERLEEKQDD